MNDEPVAWAVWEGNPHDVFLYKEEADELCRLKGGDAKSVPLYTHPAKELNEAIKIIKDFQSDDVPPCKAYEDTYADGWMDACNEILWAIEEQAQEK